MIVVTGANGQLGTAFRRLLGNKAHYLTRADLDLREVKTIYPVLDKLRPSTVINCAAYTAVDAAETDEATARIVNADAVEAMAKWCARHDARFVTFSTDYVFDGDLGRPYVESDETCPINAYGRTKVEGERRAMSANAETLVIRTSWLFSATHRNFVSVILERTILGSVKVVSDECGSPTSVDDLADCALAAVESGAIGVLHVTDRGRATRFELARTALEIYGLDTDLIQPVSSDAVSDSAPRPRYSVLGSERFGCLGLDIMPPWEQSLALVMNDLHTGGSNARSRCD